MFFKYLKREQKVMYIVSFFLGFFALLFLLAHVAEMQSASAEGLGLVEVLEQLPDHMIQSPFAVKMPNGDGVFEILMIYTAGFMLLLQGVERNSRMRHHKENGSSAWNTNLADFHKKYTEPFKKKTHEGFNNMIFSQNVALSMQGFQTRLNNNVLVLGGSGTGKSRFFIKPNILQGNCSMVITDPKGELLRSTGHFLEEQGYKVKIFNLDEAEMQYSNKYNPFVYCKSAEQVRTMVSVFMNNKKSGKSGSDPFWDNAELALLMAIAMYLWEHGPDGTGEFSADEVNFGSVMKLLLLGRVNEEDPDAETPLDKLFEIYEQENPESVAVKNWKIFKQAPGRTAASILISSTVDLSDFNLPAIRDLTSCDTLDLMKMGDEKTALFVILPSSKTTFNYLAAIMYTQLFEGLYAHVDNECPNGFYLTDAHKKTIGFTMSEEDAKTAVKDGRVISKQTVKGYKKGAQHLAYDVRFLLDEFANTGKIPEFEQKLSTMRSYGISCSIVLQSIAQIQQLYKDTANQYQTIISNCDTWLFLGGQDMETTKLISERLGKETILTSAIQKTEKSKSWQNAGRELMTPDEVGRMSNEDCIILIRGLLPFKDKKYDYPKHPNYSKTYDADSSLQIDYRRPDRFAMEADAASQAVRTSEQEKELEKREERRKSDEALAEIKRKRIERMKAEGRFKPREMDEDKVKEISSQPVSLYGSLLDRIVPDDVDFADQLSAFNTGGSGENAGARPRVKRIVDPEGAAELRGRMSRPASTLKKKKPEKPKDAYEAMGVETPKPAADKKPVRFDKKVVLKVSEEERLLAQMDDIDEPTDFLDDPAPEFLSAEDTEIPDFMDGAVLDVEVPEADLPDFTVSEPDFSEPAADGIKPTVKEAEALPQEDPFAEAEPLAEPLDDDEEEMSDWTNQTSFGSGWSSDHYGDDFGDVELPADPLYEDLDRYRPVTSDDDDDDFNSYSSSSDDTSFSGWQDDDDDRHRLQDDIMLAAYLDGDGDGFGFGW